MQVKQQLLHHWVELTELLYPNINTNQSQDETIDYITENLPTEQKLYYRLVHAFTLLNQTYRISKGSGRGPGTYQSEREDYVNALRMIQHSINPESIMNKGLWISYRTIKEDFKQTPFTSPQLRRKTGYCKSHTHSHIQALLYFGLIEPSGGYKNKGYYYRLKQKP